MSWEQIGSIIVGEATSDSFGYTLATSDDGTVLVVGTPLNDGGGGSSGSVRVFNNINNVWSQIGSDIDGLFAGDALGTSVALSSDGTIFAVGSTSSDENGTSSGAVRVFKNISNVWTLLGSAIVGTTGENAGFSVSLSNDGTIVVFGSRSSDVGSTDAGCWKAYKYDGTSWSQLGSTIGGEYQNDNLGYSISLNGAGTICAVSSIKNPDNGTNSGSVRVYQYVTNNWIKIGQDIDGEAAFDSSGQSVSLNDAGNILAIGSINNDGLAPNGGSVRVYQYVTNTWIKIGEDIDGVSYVDNFGQSVSLNNDGTILAVGAPSSFGANPQPPGLVSVYKYDSNTWIKIGEDIKGLSLSPEKFGWCVSLNNDGTILAVGATNGRRSGVPGYFGTVRVFKYTIPLVEPNAPTDISASVSGITATISFTAGVANDSIITSYKYAVSTNGGVYESFTASNWTSGTSFTIPNLTIGSNYTFKLIANNGMDSAESTESNTVTVSNFAPNAPTDISASVSVTTATISFTAGVANGSSAVTSYKYAVSTNGGAYGSFVTSNWTSGTSFTVTGLTVGSNYTFKLKANNGIDSSESSVSNTVTVSNFAPNAPTGVTASVSVTTATISFTAGVANGSLEVTSYKYAVSTDGTNYNSYVTSNWTTGTSFTVPNLTVGSNYTFKLIANNGIDSPESTASNTVTVSNFAPNAPTGISASVSGITATISFTPGVSNGSLAVTSYKYAVSTNGGAYGSFITSNWISGNSFTITGLTVGSNYAFKLIANNGIDSAESTESNTVAVSNFAPNAPTIISVNVSGRTATISFTAGAANGSSDVTGYKYAYSTTTSTGTYTPALFTSTDLSWINGTTSLTISNLPTGTLYLKLKATNGIDSSASTSSNAITVANFAPNAPTITSISASNGIATINFDQTDNQSLTISGYKYAYGTTTTTGTYTPIPFTSTYLSWTSGTTLLTISNLPIGTLYLKLIAYNGIDSSASTPSNAVTITNFAPNAPTNLIASVSGSTATINFTPGAANGSNTVTSYKYALSTNGGAYVSFTTSNWTSGTSFTVQNLTVGSNYTFKLIANNGLDSLESNVSNTVTVANFAPVTPRNLIASVSNGMVTIDFNQDSNGSLAVSTYRYALSTSGSGGIYSSFTSNNLIKVSSTKVTISGLTIGTSYNFILKANNGIDSAESTASNQVTVVNYAPAAPTITSVVLSGRTATINFSQTSNGSLTITNYRYAYSTTVDGSYSFSDSNWTSGSQITVSNLPTGSYYFKLQATNGIYSPASTASSQVEIVPDAPVIKGIQLSELTSVMLTFSQSGINTTDVNSYQYAFKTSVGGSYSSYRNTNLSWTQGTFSLTISNLTPGQNYYFKLKAVKNTSASNDSNESSGIFINFAPATPQISYIEAYNGTATINFTVSNNGSAAITKYMYSTDSTVTSNSVFYDFPLINGLEQITSPLFVNRLTNGTTYSFTIRGSNGINSQASNTINNIVMLPPLPPQRITSGELKNGTATLYIADSGLESIKNYAYSTNGVNYTTLNPVQNTSTLTITGLSTSDSVSLTVKATNGITNFSPPSNKITLIPMLSQPAPTIDSTIPIATDYIARIPFSQTVTSLNGQDAVVKYLYCTDTTITSSSVFIDVPLRDGFAQTTSPFVIPFTISNPETTPSTSFTFKSYTYSGVYSLASTTVRVNILHPQPPPILLKAEALGIGRLYIETNRIVYYRDDNANLYSYAPKITNYVFSTDGITYQSLKGNNGQMSNKYYNALTSDTLCNVSIKSFNGSYSAPSNILSNVIARWEPPPAPVITSITGNILSGAVIDFTQDTTTLTKDIKGFGCTINGIAQTVTLGPSLRSFTISRSSLLFGENVFIMNSTNGTNSPLSTPFLLNIVSVDRATYIDPSDSINTILIRQTAVNEAIQFSTDNENWTAISSWPFIIGNNSPDTKLKVQFDTDITLPYLINGTGDNFVLASRNIIFDGNNKTVTVNNFPKFPGLITNGNETQNGYNNITVKNISIVSSGTTSLLVEQGWICKRFFGKGSTGNIIQNCSSNGIISGSGGGITGSYTAISSTNFSIIGCSASGHILDGAPGAGAGGIVGAFSGANSTSFIITTCTYSGNINGNGSGGIIGSVSTSASISFCSTSGIIKGGGIAGARIGEIPGGASAIQALVTISDCFTTGDIGSTVGTKGAWSAGGIIAEQGVVVTITRCYSFGEIGGVGKNPCGGIVGSNASTGTTGTVLVQSCFSTGNIYDGCGGIAGPNFGYGAHLSNILKTGIYSCYSLGDIGHEAGGIVGPQFAALANKLCIIDNCYSLGKLLYETSGGIAGIMTWSTSRQVWSNYEGRYIWLVTPGYPTNIRTVSITNCFNSFSDNLISNSIVASGFGTPVSDRIKRSTLPSIQYDNLTPYPTVEQNTYLDALNKYPTTWRILQLSTDRQRTILRSVNGYYVITPLIIANVPFIKIPLLGFTVSELLINAGLSIQELISCKIDLTSTINEFNIAGISIGDLITAEYGIKLVNKIGYPLSSILPFTPNSTLKELIDYGINLRDNTPSYTVSQVIAPSVQPVLTMLDIVNGGFLVSDIKGRPEPMFSLYNMKEAEVPVRFLVGPGGYLTTELKKVGFDVDDFRASGFPIETIIDVYGFKPLEFQGSKFPIESYANVIKTNVFSQSMLEAIGFPKGDAMAAISLYSQQTNSNILLINTYISLNIPVSEIPKTLVITNIKAYWDTPQISSTPPGKNTYNPIDFLKNGWSKRQVGQMGFSVNVLLNSTKFDISDLKTIGYSDAVITASGHKEATNVKVKNAGIYTAQNPPIITRVVTDETAMYVYLDFSENNTSADPIAIGYSLDEDGSNLTFVPVANPLTILNMDWSVDNSLFLTSFNGMEVSAFNSISVAKYKKPEKKVVVKPNGFKFAGGIALVILSVALKSVGVDKIPLVGSSITGYLMKKGISEAAQSNVGGQVENVLAAIDNFNKLQTSITGAATGLVGIDASAIGIPPVSLAELGKQSYEAVGGVGAVVDAEASALRTLVTKDSSGSVCNYKATRLGFQTRTAWVDGRWAFNPHKIEKIEAPVFITSWLGAHHELKWRYFDYKTSMYTDVVSGNTFGPKRAITKNKVYLTSNPPTITRVVADSTTISVYFTGGMKNYERVENILYSLDNGNTWKTAGDTLQNSSPFVITGEYKLYDEMKICIRFYDKTDIANVNSGYNVFGMNDFYSNNTSSGSCTYPIKIGRFGNPSNIVPVKMNFLPLVPELYYVRYNSSKNNLASVYFVQNINCSGQIVNFEWSKDNGKVWTSVGKSITQLPLLSSNDLLAPASLGQFTTKMTYFDIDVGKVPGLTIMIRAVNSRDLRSNSSEKVTSSNDEINVWINKPANTLVYGKIKV